MQWINRLYILIVGVVLTLTTGFGIAAFYPQPVSPLYPTERPYPKSCAQSPEAAKSPECVKYEEEQQALRVEYDQKNQEYQNKNAAYTRTAVFFGISIGVLLAVVGIALLKRSKLVAAGMLLAGLLTAVLTRFTIMIASLGGSVSGTQGADMIGIAEFIILLVLSVAVVYVGLTTLKEA